MESLDRLAYTFDTAAVAISRTRACIVRMVKQGEIKAEWRGGQQLITRAELMRWLEEGDSTPSGRGGNAAQAIRTRWAREKAAGPASKQPASKRRAAK
jgi:excisionase family DNA binding protein